MTIAEFITARLAEEETAVSYAGPGFTHDPGCARRPVRVPMLDQPVRGLTMDDLPLAGYELELEDRRQDGYGWSRTDVGWPPG